MPNVTTQFPAVIQLSQLNGQNGFKIDGEAVGESSGRAVSAVGDINADGYMDLLIGAPGYNNTGRSYVVFGRPDIGSSGLFALSSLNGTNGFKIDGEVIGDGSGYSVMVGDINGDGYADILIGAPYHDSDAGRSYVIFGGVNVGGNGLLALSSLNGTNGFKIDGEAVGEGNSGLVISAAGDINGDGYGDLIIGASNYNSYTGRSYVIFGGSLVENSGLLALSSLNGTNGFKVDAEANGDYNGVSVNTAGDVNSDGYIDFLIGAIGHNSITGRSYLIFGGPTVSDNGLLPLSSLDGSNGFKLDGEASADMSGNSVSTAGDINGDGYPDILIGAPSHNGYAGRSYVVFGGRIVGNNGLLALANLDGFNGFKLDAETLSEKSGWSVSAAGDINGDGYADILVGSPYYYSRQGRSYVVFGGPTVGKNGVLALSSLNGINGFQLKGEEVTGESGISVSGGGDVNGDGYADVLIGAPYYNNNVGRSYIIFGDKFSLSANNLIIHQNQTLILNGQNLNATDASHSVNSISFIIDNVQHGRFTLVNASSQEITQFSQFQVYEGKVQFIHDGGLSAPNYTMQIQGQTFAVSSPSIAEVTFYRQPTLDTFFSIHQGESVLVTSTWLNVTDDYPADQVNFIVSNLQHCQFQLLPLNNSVLQFTEQQLLAEEVVFTQDDSSSAPSYQIEISDPYFTLPPTPASITFYRKPSLTSNRLTIDQGQRLLFTAAFLTVTSEDYPADQVVFTVTHLLHGQFQLLPLNSSIMEFTEQSLLSDQVVFAHDSSPTAPSYAIEVSDPYFTLPPQAADVAFTPLPPFFIQNELTVLQGRSATLTLQNLQGGDPDITFDKDNLTFIVSEVQHGYFHFIATPIESITQFTQAQIGDEEVQFLHDGTIAAPSYQVVLSDGRLSTSPETAAISFDTAPVFINNRLSIAPGETQLLDTGDVFATDDHTPEADLVFTPGNVVNGHFTSVLNPELTITTFSQQQISSSEIEFIADGSDQAPSYVLTVADTSGLTTTQDAQITFNLPPSSSSTNSDTIRNAIIGAVVSGVVGLLFFGFKICLLRRAEKYFEQATLQMEEGTTARKQADFHQNVIRPLTKKILERIKLTGLLGYISKETTDDAISAIVALVSELEKQGVNLDLSQMTAVGQSRFLDTIARQTRRALVPETGYCSIATFSRFFCPETTPRQLEEKALVIAQAVKEALSRDHSLAPAVVSEPGQFRESMELKSSVIVVDSEQPPESKMEEDLLSPSQQQMPSDAEERPRVSSNPARTFAVGQGKQALAMSLTGVGVGATVGALDLHL